MNKSGTTPTTTTTKSKAQSNVKAGKKESDHHQTVLMMNQDTRDANNNGKRRKKSIVGAKKSQVGRDNDNDDGGDDDDDDGYGDDGEHDNGHYELLIKKESHAVDNVMLNQIGNNGRLHAVAAPTAGPDKTKKTNKKDGNSVFDKAAVAAKEEVEKFLASGLDSCIYKPVSIAMIKDILKELLLV